jgi:hypothetical protein
MIHMTRMIHMIRMIHMTRMKKILWMTCLAGCHLMSEHFMDQWHRVNQAAPISLWNDYRRAGSGFLKTEVMIRASASMPGWMAAYFVMAFTNGSVIRTKLLGSPRLLIPTLIERALSRARTGSHRSAR